MPKAKSPKFPFVERLDQQRKLLTKIGRAIEGVPNDIASECLIRVLRELNPPPQANSMSAVPQMPAQE